MSSALINLGHVYKLQKKYSKAEVEFEKGLDIAKKFGIKHLMAEALVEIGELYLETNRKAKSVEFIEKGLRISEEIGFAEYIEKGKAIREKLK